MSSGPDYLVYKTERVPIGVRVKTYLEDGVPSFYRTRDNKKRFTRITFETIEGSRKMLVNKVVLHHDGTPNSLGCFRVLEQRNLSTHLMIDYDGTVWQPLDLSDIAWHGHPVNKESVGIDINNPVRPDRARDQIPERGIFQGRINGGQVASLGYTNAQYESLIAVLQGLFRIFSKIRPEAPVGEDGKVLRDKLVNTAVSGVVGHLHMSANKWDPGPGFDWERVLIGIRGNRIYYPVTLVNTPNLAQVPKKKALSNAEAYFRNTESGPDGFFPFGLSQEWHTGVHLNFEEAGAPVYAPIDGQVLVARNIDPVKMGSPNVVVIKHRMKVSGFDKTFFSIISHMQKSDPTPESDIPWIKRFAQQESPPLPPADGDEPPATPGYLAFRNGYVALCEVDVKAGEIIGRVGTFTSEVDGSDPRPLIDIGVIAGQSILPGRDSTFEMVDEDEDEDILCNARAVWKRYTTDPDALRGLAEGGYPLAPIEIRSFFKRPTSAALRWLAVRHITEWSTRADFGGLFGGGVDFEWALRDQARRYVARIRKFLWWDDNVTQHTTLRGHVVWCYHPVALYTILAMGEARDALRPGENGPVQALSADELRRARVEDAQREREAGFADGHDHVYVDVIEGVDTYEEAGDDPEGEGWMRWEPGEWEPD